jgi:RNA polymerase sigma factor (sigma-70 family)
MLWLLDADTEIGGPDGRFPDTRHSALLRVRNEEPAQRTLACEVLIAAYWKPVYRYIRLKWRTSNEDAKDLTQAFFALAIETNLLQTFDRGKGTFRTYLRTCLDRFLANRHRYSSREKRSAVLVPLDGFVAEGIPSPDHSSEELFQREYARSLFSDAIEELRATLRPIAFAVFALYDLAEPAERLSYKQIASELDIPVTAVTNHLALARRELRRILLDRLRTITRDESELRHEVRALFHQ